MSSNDAFDVDESQLVGDWKGQGTELYFEVDKDKSKIYKLGFKVNINFKKVENDIYRIRIKYYYSKTGTRFGLKYKKGDLAGSTSGFVNRTKDGFISSDLWYKKDPLSRTVETFTFDSDKNLTYRYNTNQITNPFNSYFARLSNWLMQTGKISVSGSYLLKKVD